MGDIAVETEVFGTMPTQSEFETNEKLTVNCKSDTAKWYTFDAVCDLDVWLYSKDEQPIDTVLATVCAGFTLSNSMTTSPL